MIYIWITFGLLYHYSVVVDEFEKICLKIQFMNIRNIRRIVPSLHYMIEVFGWTMEKYVTTFLMSEF